MSKNHRIVSHADWVSARVELLQGEKEMTRERDALYDRLRSLPWEKVEVDYEFDGEDGRVQLSDMFGEHSQLIVYHFMFGEDWDEGCPTCSQVTDILDRTAVHLGARDVSLVLISAAPLNSLLAFRQRMGWALPWYSAHDSEFNVDFQASVHDVDEDGNYYYNYEKMSKYPVGEQPGISVFVKDDEGSIFHNYSVYARGLETFMPTYGLLDIVPKRRNEGSLDWNMQWIRHRDRYPHAVSDATNE